jgi:hypothetical protein
VLGLHDSGLHPASHFLPFTPFPLEFSVFTTCSGEEALRPSPQTSLHPSFIHSLGKQTNSQLASGSGFIHKNVPPSGSINSLHLASSVTCCKLCCVVRFPCFFIHHLTSVCVSLCFIHENGNTFLPGFFLLCVPLE